MEKTVEKAKKVQIGEVSEVINKMSWLNIFEMTQTVRNGIPAKICTEEKILIVWKIDKKSDQNTTFKII